MPGVLESSVADAAGDWRVAPMPTYDGTPATAENGGSGQSVLEAEQEPGAGRGVPALAEQRPGVDRRLPRQRRLPGDDRRPRGPGVPRRRVGVLRRPEDQRGAHAGLEATWHPGWQYLPYQVYANSIFGDTVGQSYANKVDLNEGLADWQEQLVEYGNEQGFTVNE